MEELTPNEVKALHEFKRLRKEITKRLDNEEFKEELRDLRRGDDDEEQGKPVHKK